MVAGGHSTGLTFAAAHSSAEPPCRTFDIPRTDHLICLRQRIALPNG